MRHLGARLLDLCAPATMTITEYGRGEIPFGALQARLDIEYSRSSIGFACDCGDKCIFPGFLGSPVAPLVMDEVWLFSIGDAYDYDGTLEACAGRIIPTPHMRF